jgi:hypothetical protein
VKSAVQVYPGSVKEVVGLFLMVPISTALSVLKAIAAATR